jgi:hypothetical protein
VEAHDPALLPRVGFPSHKVELPDLHLPGSTGPQPPLPRLPARGSNSSRETGNVKLTSSRT